MSDTNVSPSQGPLADPVVLDFLATAAYGQKRQALLNLQDDQLEALRRAVDDEIFFRQRATKNRRKIASRQERVP